eukprot:TRINITY_DN54146_c0_g1_i1.p1 TRINITY_DN54146_c0_g1~~TRINITY_DN54146_c0_g1_i1.p1  ORF type:complete len:273 (-),score=31.21 TRINITY_DN54146_c0_g1_i1:12-830(-)
MACRQALIDLLASGKSVASIRAAYLQATTIYLRSGGDADDVLVAIAEKVFGATAATEDQPAESVAVADATPPAKRARNGEGAPKTEAEYDTFLKTVKAGRFVREGPFLGMSKPTLHRCTDTECGRTWSPVPSQTLSDDYYCPSCVLHHRNNEDRFAIDRLKWTADVPNTFYVFRLRDPRGKALIKFGRTQHADAWKRYTGKERSALQMELLKSVRGRLADTTRIENWWKEEATRLGLFCQMSDKTFHGKDECLDLDEATLARMLVFNPVQTT